MSLHLVTEDGVAWVTVPNLINWVGQYVSDLEAAGEPADQVRRIVETLLLFDALRPKEEAADD